MNEVKNLNTEKETAVMTGLEGGTDDLSTQEMEDKGRRYLIFVIDDLKLGVDAEFVVEILSSHTATALPLVPN